MCLLIQFEIHSLQHHPGKTGGEYYHYFSSHETQLIKQKPALLVITTAQESHSFNKPNKTN